ncbi:MAG: glycosyltransferase family 39 protein [Promethearchaeota archaeon]
MYLIFAFYFHEIFQETDGYAYYEYYQDIVLNDLPPRNSEFWPFGLPILIGSLSLLIGDFFIAGKIIIVEFSILFLFSIYISIRKVFNDRVAIFTYLFIATHVNLIIVYFTILGDIPFASLIILSVYFLFDNTTESKKNLIYSSIFLGLATMIRWTGLLCLPVIFVKIILDNMKISNNLLKKKIYNITIHLFICFGVFLLTILPYLFINTLWWGSPFYNDQIFNIHKAMKIYEDSESYHYNKEEASWFWFFFGPEAPLFYEQWFYSFFIEFPRLFVINFEFPFDIGRILFNLILALIFIIYSIKYKKDQDISKNKFLFITFLVTFFFIIIFIGFLGLIFFFFLILIIFIYYTEFKKRKANPHHEFLFIFFFLIFYLLIISMGFAELRFLFPILPFLIAPLIFIVLKLLDFFLRNIVLVFEKLNKFNKNFLRDKRISYCISIIIAIFFVFQLISSYDRVILYKKIERVEYRIAGEFLRDKIDENDKIIGNKKNYRYYIGKGVILNVPNAENINQFFLDIQSADYLIICEALEVFSYPELDFLLNTSSVDIPDFLIPIYNYEKPGRRIVIYEIL